MFDDCGYKDVRNVVNYIRAHLSESLREIDLRPFREGTGPKYEIARLLGRVQLVAFEKFADVERGLIPTRLARGESAAD